jgi:catalase
MNSYQRDGFMRFDDNGGGRPNYWPNSFGGPGPDPELVPPSIDVTGMAARHAYKLGDIDFKQAGVLYRRVMNNTDRENLAKNIIGHLKDAKKNIQLRQTALFYKADPDYGKRVNDGLGLSIKEVKRLAGMPQEERVRLTSE